MGKFFIVLGVILSIVFMLWAVFVVYSRITAKKIMNEGRNKKSFTFNFLSMRFSRLDVLKNVNLLIDAPSAPNGRYIANIGLVFVNKGGIIIIDTVPGSGFIEVNEGGQWSRSINDKYYTFEDPFNKGRHKVKVMKMFLRSEGVENVPVNYVVLFSGKRVKLSKRLNGVITADGLVPYIKDVNMDKYLTYREIRSVVRLLREKNV